MPVAAIECAGGGRKAEAGRDGSWPLGPGCRCWLAIDEARMHGRASLCLVAVPCRRRGGKLSLRSFLVPRCLALAALSLDTSIVTDSSGDNLGSIP